MLDTNILAETFGIPDAKVYVCVRAVGKEILMCFSLPKGDDAELDMSGAEAQKLAKNLETLRAHSGNGFAMECSDVTDREFDVQGVRCTYDGVRYGLTIWTSLDTESRIVSCSLSASETQSLLSALEEGACLVGFDSVACLNDGSSGPKTPGRNKKLWEHGDGVIIHEEHPYHPGAPDYHKKPHYHGSDHKRYKPGDPIPPS